MYSEGMSCRVILYYLLVIAFVLVPAHVTRGGAAAQVAQAIIGMRLVDDNDHG